MKQHEQLLIYFLLTVTFLFFARNIWWTKVNPWAPQDISAHKYLHSYVSQIENSVYTNTFRVVPTQMAVLQTVNGYLYVTSGQVFFRLRF